MAVKLYYIENVAHSGNCRLFWRPEGEGYTTNLDEAWQVPGAQALQISKNRPEQDIPQQVTEMNARAMRHVPR